MAIQFKQIGTPQQSILMETRFEKRYSTVDDVTHDLNHIHDCYEIYVKLSGDVSFLVEDTIYTPQVGDVIVTRPRQIHRCLYHTDCLHTHFCIWLKEIPFPPSEPHWEKESFISLPKEQKEQLIAHCFSLCKHMEQNNTHGFGIMRDIYSILDILFSDRQQQARANELPKAFSDIIEYISKHYNEAGCTVATLCEKFYISKSTLNRHFRQHFQTTPSDYIESKRLSEAKKLLHTGMSVQDTCFMCGFSGCSYFVLRFRKRFAITPHQYQKQVLAATGSYEMY